MEAAVTLRSSALVVDRQPLSFPTRLIWLGLIAAATCTMHVYLHGQEITRLRKRELMDLAMIKRLSLDIGRSLPV
jgi:hypothetical protein